MRKINGFTFVELLVVITIIGVVFAAGVVSYTQISKNSRDARRRSDLESIRQALEICRSIAGRYPATIYPASESIVCNDASNTVSMKKTPLDPKPCNVSGQYTYIYSAATGEYNLTADCMDTGGPLTVTNP